MTLRCADEQKRIVERIEDELRGTQFARRSAANALIDDWYSKR
jgi:hypothetical protein